MHFYANVACMQAEVQACRGWQHQHLTEEHGWRRLDPLNRRLGYTIDNMFPSCSRCNMASGSKSLLENIAIIKIDKPDWTPLFLSG